MGFFLLMPCSWSTLIVSKTNISNLNYTVYGTSGAQGEVPEGRFLLGMTFLRSGLSE
jgi:hypothetical protein